MQQGTKANEMIVFNSNGAVHARTNDKNIYQASVISLVHMHYVTRQGTAHG